MYNANLHGFLSALIFMHSRADIAPTQEAANYRSRPLQISSENISRSRYVFFFNRDTRLTLFFIGTNKLMVFFLQSGLVFFFFFSGCSENAESGVRGAECGVRQKNK